MSVRDIEKTLRFKHVKELATAIGAVLDWYSGCHGWRLYYSGAVVSDKCSTIEEIEEVVAGLVAYVVRKGKVAEQALETWQQHVLQDKGSVG
jgi:hypothetical protein